MKVGRLQMPDLIRPQCTYLKPVSPPVLTCSPSLMMAVSPHLQPLFDDRVDDGGPDDAADGRPPCRGEERPLCRHSLDDLRAKERQRSQDERGAGDKMQREAKAGEEREW